MMKNVVKFLALICLVIGFTSDVISEEKVTKDIVCNPNDQNSLKECQTACNGVGSALPVPKTMYACCSNIPNTVGSGETSVCACCPAKIANHQCRRDDADICDCVLPVDLCKCDEKPKYAGGYLKRQQSIYNRSCI